MAVCLAMRGFSDDMLQGVRSCAINAACLALIDAGIPLHDFVVSCSTGFLDGVPILGLHVQVSFFYASN